jgi:flagellar basal body-associated protein FliL
MEAVMKKIILIIVGAILLVGVAVTVTVIVVGGEPDNGASEVAQEVEEFGDEYIYHEFHPNFVVHIMDGEKSRFLALNGVYFSKFIIE